MTITNFFYSYSYTVTVTVTEARATSGQHAMARKEVPCILITHRIERPTTRTVDGPLTGNTRNTVVRHA